MDELAAVEMGPEGAVEERKDAVGEARECGMADLLLEGVRLRFLRVKLVREEDDAAHGGEIGVRGGVPVHAFEDLPICDGRVLMQPPRPNWTVEQDGCVPLDGVDGDAESISFFYQPTAGDVPCHVVGGCRELCEVRVDGVGRGQLAGDATYAVHVQREPARQAIETRLQGRWEGKRSH
jgi:hypothetical protein